MVEDRHRWLARVLGIPEPASVEEEEEEEEREEEKEKEEAEEFSLDELITPAQVQVEGLTLILVEVKKHKFPWGTTYRVCCKLKDGKWVSKSFSLFVKNAEELKEQVKREIATYLTLKNQLGEEVVKTL